MCGKACRTGCPKSSGNMWNWSMIDKTDFIKAIMHNNTAHIGMSYV